MTAELNIPEECRLCAGVVCVDFENGQGRVQNETNGVKPVDLTKIKIIGTPIAGCKVKEMKEVENWFEGEGKTDTLHLGS